MNNIVGRFMSAWLHPWATMESIKQEGDAASPTPSMIFIIVMGLISGVITALWGTFLPAAAGGSRALVWLSVVVVPLVSFIGSFIGALIIWGLVDGLLKGVAAQYWTSYRILAVLAAFSPLSAALAPVPTVGQYLAIAVNLWATVVMIRGIIIVRGTRPVRTWITCGLIFGLLFILGIAARVAAQRQLQGGPGSFSSFEQPGEDDLSLDGNLDEQLNELAEKAKAGQKTAAPKQ